LFAEELGVVWRRVDLFPHGIDSQTFLFIVVLKVETVVEVHQSQVVLPALFSDLAQLSSHQFFHRQKDLPPRLEVLVLEVQTLLVQFLKDAVDLS
jgi:hypothetical protein